MFINKIDELWNKHKEDVRNALISYGCEDEFSDLDCVKALYSTFLYQYFRETIHACDYWSLEEVLSDIVEIELPRSIDLDYSKCMFVIPSVIADPTFPSNKVILTYVAAGGVEMGDSCIEWAMNICNELINNMVVPYGI